MLIFFTTMISRKRLVFFFIFTFSLISMAAAQSSFHRQNITLLGDSIVHNTATRRSIFNSRLHSVEIEGQVYKGIHLTTGIPFKKTQMHGLKIQCGIIFLAAVAVLRYILVKMDTNGFHRSSQIMGCGTFSLETISRTFVLSFKTPTTVMDSCAHLWGFMKRRLVSKIAFDSRYLHQESNQQAIHADSKSSIEKSADVIYERSPNLGMYRFLENGLLHHMSSIKNLILRTAYNSHHVSEVDRAFQKIYSFPLHWESIINDYSFVLGKFIWERWASCSISQLTCFLIDEKDPNGDEENANELKDKTTARAQEWFQQPVSKVEGSTTQKLFDVIPVGIVSRRLQVFETTQLFTKYPHTCTKSVDTLPTTKITTRELENPIVVSLQTTNATKEIVSLSINEAKSNNPASFIPLHQRKRETTTAICSGNKNMAMKAPLEVNETIMHKPSLNLENERKEGKIELNNDKNKNHQPKEQHNKTEAQGPQREEAEKKQMAMRRNYNITRAKTTIKPSWRP